MFDPNADPERVASRAAELALEQLERLRHRSRYMKDQSLNDIGLAFYSEPFEVGISNNIATLMAGYAVLKGYVTEEQAQR
jgi:hypothetical protein